MFVAKSHARRYEAVAIVRVAESKSGDTAEPARAENYRPLFENKTIAASLVKDFNLKTEAQVRLGRATAGRSRPIASCARSWTSSLIAGTNLMRVRVKLADRRDLAAKVTNALVERAVDLNRRINQQEVVDARDYIKSQLEEATRRVDELRDQFVALKQRSQVDALRKDAEGQLELRSKLVELQAGYRRGARLPRAARRPT